MKRFLSLIVIIFFSQYALLTPYALAAGSGGASVRGSASGSTRDPDTGNTISGEYHPDGAGNWHTDITVTNPNGEVIDRYTVDENGNIIREEAQPPAPAEVKPPKDIGEKPAKPGGKKPVKDEVDKPAKDVGKKPPKKDEKVKSPGGDGEQPALGKEGQPSGGVVELPKTEVTEPPAEIPQPPPGPKQPWRPRLLDPYFPFFPYPALYIIIWIKLRQAAILSRRFPRLRPGGRQRIILMSYLIFMLPFLFPTTLREPEPPSKQKSVLDFVDEFTVISRGPDVGEQARIAMIERPRDDHHPQQES